MKKIINQFFFLSLLVAVIASCKKDEKQVLFEGGTAPLFSSSTTADMVLIRPNADLHAVTFSWTNPDYQFNTGLSSQDVYYYIQVDTLGANFTNPNKQEIAVTNDLSKDLTVKELNTALSKLDVAPEIPHNISFRIKATLKNNTVPVYSDVITIKIVPYLDVAVPLPPTGVLYITGSACPSDWTNNPPATQKCKKLNDFEYYVTRDFVPGKQYKFLSNLSQWQPQYGASNKPGASYNADGGDFSENMGGGSDPDAFPTPSAAGTYKITLNFKTGKFAVVKL